MIASITPIWHLHSWTNQSAAEAQESARGERERERVMVVLQVGVFSCPFLLHIAICFRNISVLTSVKHDLVQNNIFREEQREKKAQGVFSLPCSPSTQTFCLTKSRVWLVCFSLYVLNTRSIRLPLCHTHIHTHCCAHEVPTTNPLHDLLEDELSFTSKFLYSAWSLESVSRFWVDMPETGLGPWNT